MYALSDFQANIEPFTPKFNKIHYGCGERMLADWQNVDIKDFSWAAKNNAFARANLTGQHPFPDNFFKFGFAEDFLEHLTQPDSLVFFAEAYRTFAKDGVLRLSFPGFENILRSNYQESNALSACSANNNVYTQYNHFHFYSREELTLVAKNFGFRKVNFVEFGRSAFPELNGLDHRQEQVGLNTYVEIVK